MLFVQGRSRCEDREFDSDWFLELMSELVLALERQRSAVESHLPDSPPPLVTCRQSWEQVSLVGEAEAVILSQWLVHKQDVEVGSREDSIVYTGWR